MVVLFLKNIICLTSLNFWGVFHALKKQTADDVHIINDVAEEVSKIFLGNAPLESTNVVGFPFFLVPATAAPPSLPTNNSSRSWNVSEPLLGQALENLPTDDSSETEAESEADEPDSIVFVHLPPPEYVESGSVRSRASSIIPKSSRRTRAIPVVLREPSSRVKNLLAANRRHASGVEALMLDLSKSIEAFDSQIRSPWLDKVSRFNIQKEKRNAIIRLNKLRRDFGKHKAQFAKF